MKVFKKKKNNKYHNVGTVSKSNPKNLDLNSRWLPSQDKL